MTSPAFFLTIIISALFFGTNSTQDMHIHDDYS